MNFKFWLTFLISALLCLSLAFLAGLVPSKFREAHQEKALFKQSAKLDSFWFMRQLDKKIHFLTQSARDIQDQKKISSNSPFLALGVFYKKQLREIYGTDTAPSKAEGQRRKNPSEANARKKKLLSEQRKIFLEFSKKAPLEVRPQAFQFHITEEAGKKRIIFVKRDGADKKYIALLKDNKNFFILNSLDKNSQKRAKKAVFVVNSQGRFFFHNKSSSIFKKLSTNSPVWKSLKDLPQSQFPRGRYLQSRKKSPSQEIYYLQKWRGSEDMILVSKIHFTPLFFLSKKPYFIGGIVGFLIFILSLSVFLFKLFSLVSAYQFLKLAFVSFGNTGWFLSSKDSKNPLLYFYNNRRRIFNQPSGREREDEEESTSLNFQEIVQQELERLKSQYPRLSVYGNYNFDAKVFRFEKFLRHIVRELLRNALEAMGSQEKLKLELSAREEGDYFVFSIRDYGIGIPHKDYKKPFQMYYSTKSQLGAGLNLVQTIVQSNEGRIEMSSPQDGGLKVCVYLPLKCFLKNYFEIRGSGEK